MPKSCCAVGCTNHNMMERKISFFTFPKDPERWGKWVNAVKRVNPDGSKWKPSQNTVLCGDHFIQGKPNCDPNHPDYVPSVFKHSKSSTKENDSKIKRFAAAAKRKISFTPTPAKRRHLSPAHSNDQQTPVVSTVPATDQYIASPDSAVSETGFSKPVIDSEREIFHKEINSLRQEKDGLLKINKTLNDRLSVSELSSKTVENNDEKCQFYAGVSWGVFVTTLNFLVQFLKPTDVNKKFPFQEQFFVTLVKLRHDMPFEMLASIKGVSQSCMSEVFWKWINLIHGKLNFLIKWPGREFIRKTLPGTFKSKFPRLTAIIDCFEIFIERPKKLKARAKCYSNYKKHSTVKFFIACTPNGAVSFLSKAWGGRVSDVEIVRQSGFIDSKYHMPGDQILADRGFTLQDEFAAACSTELIIPAFTKGKRQLSAQEIEISRKISSVRIHVERVIGLLKQRFKILQGSLPINVIKSITDEASTEEFARVDKLVGSCAILVNLGEFSGLYSYPFLVICQYMGYPSGRNLSYFQNTLQNEMHP